MKRAMLPIKTKVHPIGFPPVAETLPGAIERIVSEKLEQGSMEIVAAAFSNQINNCTLRLPKLGAEAVALNTKLLNGID